MKTIRRTVSEIVTESADTDTDTDRVLVGCDAVSTGKYLQTIRRSAVPPSFGYSRPREKEGRESFWD